MLQVQEPKRVQHSSTKHSSSIPGPLKGLKEANVRWALLVNGQSPQDFSVPCAHPVLGRPLLSFFLPSPKMGAGVSQSCCQGESQRVVCDLDHSSSVSLLYLDKEIEDDLTSTRGSSDSSSRASHGHTGKLRGVPVQRVQASIPLMKASSLDRSGVDELSNVLRSHGVDTTSWGRHGTKAIEHLFWELFVQHGSILTGVGTASLKRVTRLLKLRVLADIGGVDHVVVSRLQFMHDGQQIQRQQLPLRRLCWKLPSDSPLLPSCEANLYNEDYEYVESWRSCCMSVLEERLGLSTTTAQQQLKEVANTHRAQFKALRVTSWTDKNLVKCFACIGCAQSGVRFYVGHSLSTN